MLPINPGRGLDDAYEATYRWRLPLALRRQPCEPQVPELGHEAVRDGVAAALEVVHEEAELWVACRYVAMPVYVMKVSKGGHDDVVPARAGTNENAARHDENAAKRGGGKKSA